MLDGFTYPPVRQAAIDKTTFGMAASHSATTCALVRRRITPRLESCRWLADG